MRRLRCWSIGGFIYAHDGDGDVMMMVVVVVVMARCGRSEMSITSTSHHRIDNTGAEQPDEHPVGLRGS